MDILKFKELTLLDQTSWDDKNDKAFIDLYLEKSTYNSALTLCLTRRIQTYHHWRIFSSGMDGVCIHFNEEKLLSSLLVSAPKIIARKVAYKSTEDLKKMTVKVDDLPFLKRNAYKDEGEFRLLYPTEIISAPPHKVAIDMDSITNIYLSPWMPPSLADTVKEQLASLGTMPKGKILLSRIKESQDWIRRVKSKIE